MLAQGIHAHNAQPHTQAASENTCFVAIIHACTKDSRTQPFTPHTGCQWEHLLCGHHRLCGEWPGAACHPPAVGSIGLAAAPAAPVPFVLCVPCHQQVDAAQALVLCSCVA